MIRKRGAQMRKTAADFRGSRKGPCYDVGNVGAPSGAIPAVQPWLRRIFAAC
jgi:hypothetical protein